MCEVQFHYHCFNKPIEIKLDTSINIIKFSRFNQYLLCIWDLPDSILYINYGDDFNQKIDVDRLPKYIKNIEFGFNKNVDNLIKMLIIFP